MRPKAAYNDPECYDRFVVWAKEHWPEGGLPTVEARDAYDAVVLGEVASRDAERCIWTLPSDGVFYEGTCTGKTKYADGFKGAFCPYCGKRVQVQHIDQNVIANEPCDT